MSATAASLLFAATAVCPAGLSAFTSQFLPIVQNGPCADCHTGDNPQAPSWLAGKPEEIYLSVKNYVNFTDAPHARIAIRAGNQHCGTACDAAMRQQVIGGIAKWWTGGESTCPASSALLTHAQKIPAALPKDKYVTMEWSLRDVDVALDGLNFQVEIRRFTDAAGTTPGSYELRQPRLVGTKQVEAAVAGVQVLVNLKQQDAANEFTRIDAHVGPAAVAQGTWTYPVLSPETLLLVEDQPLQDQLTLAFTKVLAAPAPTCQHLAEFTRDVMPIVKVRCVACHASSVPTAFDMHGDDASVCAKFLQRTWPDQSVLPVIVQYPLAGRFEHPEVIPSRDEVVPAWTDWIRTEQP